MPTSPAAFFPAPENSFAGGRPGAAAPWGATAAARLLSSRIRAGARLLRGRSIGRGLVVSRRAAEVAAELAPSLDDPQALALVPPEEADLTALPLDPATLDLVASFSVLHGVARWDHALDEVGRVLRAGGHLLLGMPGGALAPTPACSPAAAATRFHRSGLRTVATAHLDLPLRPPLGVRLYHVWLVEKI